LNIILDKLIKRSSKNHIQSILSKNTNWKVLDIGCGYTANKFATTICDTQDLSEFYKDKNFMKLSSKNLPFEDKEFDFVIASHVLEHVEDLKFFINELERVSNKGYIELPTKLEDNLVFENKKDHLWHMDFNDVDSKLTISKKLQFIEPILTVSMLQEFRKNFKNSLILELYWENKIDYDFIENDQNFKKLSLISLFKKFFSKKIRSIIN
jgi:ubiquinone/menaquinone biosynthesis C-methylase UbiE|tara:strand:- start:966 stop:1595 length:630 start_codon:yes stop_codon:yes gene_type:complete